LDINHVARSQVAKIAAHYHREIQQASINLPIGTGLALPFVTVFLRRYARYFGLQEEMYARLRDKSKHRYQRPGQNAGLLTRQFGNNLAVNLVSSSSSE